MTDQPPTVDADTDLEIVVPPPGGADLAVSGDAVWRPGSTRSGLDDRVEFAVLGDRVAVRDPDRPDAPGLMFTRPDWEALCGLGAPAEIDLRDE